MAQAARLTTCTTHAYSHTPYVFSLQAMAKCPVCRDGINDVRKVYISSECAYCLDVPEYMVANSCGHCSCEPCLDKIIRGGYGLPTMVPAPAEPNWESVWSVTPFPEFIWYDESLVIWAAKPVLYDRFFRFDLIDMTTGEPWTGIETPPAPPGSCTSAQLTIEGWQVYLSRALVPLN